MEFGRFCFGIIVSFRVNPCLCSGARTNAGRRFFVICVLLKDCSLKKNDTCKRGRGPDDVALFDKVCARKFFASDSSPASVRLPASAAACFKFYGHIFSQSLFNFARHFRKHPACESAHGESFCKMPLENFCNSSKAMTVCLDRTSLSGLGLSLQNRTG